VAGPVPEISLRLVLESSEPIVLAVIAVTRFGVRKQRRNAWAA
jgi:hypothetical protein